MTLYRNKKTGATIETPCKISGGNWEEAKTSKRKRKKGEVVEPATELTEETEEEIVDEEEVVDDEDVVDEVDSEGGEEE